MSKHQQKAVQPQQPEEIIPVANTSDQPASPEAGRDLKRITLPEPVTLKSVAESYLEHLSFGTTKYGTVIAYRKVLDLAIAYFGADRQIDSILVPHTAKFFASNMANFLENGKPKAEATKKQIRRVFRQMLEFAQTYGFVAKVNVPNAELQHARRKQAQPPQPAETSPVEATETAEITEPEVAIQN